MCTQIIHGHGSTFRGGGGRIQNFRGPHSGRNDLKNAKLIGHHHPPKFHLFLREILYCLVKKSKTEVKIVLLMACSSSLDDSSPSARHVFVLASSSNLRGNNRTYPTILESADHALFKMVRYVLLRPLRPELDAKTTRLKILPVLTREHYTSLLHWV
jgi:hypothetical protein